MSPHFKYRKFFTQKINVTADILHLFKILFFLYLIHTILRFYAQDSYINFSCSRTVRSTA